MRLSVDEAMAAYNELSPKIFSKAHHRLKINGKLQGRSDSETLETGVKELLQKKGFKTEELF